MSQHPTHPQPVLNEDEISSIRDRLSKVERAVFAAKIRLCQGKYLGAAGAIREGAATLTDLNNMIVNDTNPTLLREFHRPEIEVIKNPDGSSSVRL